MRRPFLSQERWGGHNVNVMRVNYILVGASDRVSAHQGDDVTVVQACAEQEFGSAKHAQHQNMKCRRTQPGELGPHSGVGLIKGWQALLRGTELAARSGVNAAADEINLGPIHLLQRPQFIDVINFCLRTRGKLQQATAATPLLLYLNCGVRCKNPEIRVGNIWELLLDRLQSITGKLQSPVQCTTNRGSVSALRRLVITYFGPWVATCSLHSSSRARTASLLR